MLLQLITKNERNNHKYQTNYIVSRYFSNSYFRNINIPVPKYSYPNSFYIIKLKFSNSVAIKFHHLVTLSDCVSSCLLTDWLIVFCFCFFQYFFKIIKGLMEITKSPYHMCSNIYTYICFGWFFYFIFALIFIKRKD